MSLSLTMSIAKSLLMARFKQTMVAAVGVTFSITMFISLLGFMTGLNNLLDGLMMNRTAHVRLYNEVEPSEIQPIERDSEFAKGYHFIQSVKPKSTKLQIRNYGAIMQALRKDTRVLGISPKVSCQVFYNVGATDLSGIVSGIDVEAESKLFSFSDYVVEGDLYDLKNTPNSIILGIGAAQKMMASIGDVIQLTTSKGNLIQLKVVAFFQSGLQELDKSQSYVSIATAQKMLGESNSYITDIQIKLKDMLIAPEVAKEYGPIFEVEAVDIQTANAQFETGSSARTLISYAVSITLLIVAGFGIYNILNMMIYDKMDSIAILKATGFSGRDVNRIFITIALTIGIVGGFLGLVLGFSMSLLIDAIPYAPAALPTIKTYPVAYNPSFYITGIIFSLVTTYFAGYFPARKASRVDPVVIIRGK